MCEHTFEGLYRASAMNIFGMKLDAALKKVLAGDVAKAIQDEEDKVATGDNGQQRVPGRRMMKRVVEHVEQEAHAGE